MIDASSDRGAYAQALRWHWQKQQPEGKALGNAAGFAFEVDLTTLTRETAQNSVDELLVGEQTVDLHYTVIELAGEELATFLDRLQFDELRPHLEAAAASKQKAAGALRAGLKSLQDDDRLFLLRVADYNANGLMGPEYDDGRFTAVLRDTLNSQKGEYAGGSYGLGKATMWVASSLGLVIANSDLSVPQEEGAENRFFGRVELPWHELGEDRFAGPGWYGIPDETHEQSITKSYFGNAALAEDLYLGRPDDRPGTSFLIVGAYDPSGEADGIEEIAAVIRRAAATNFWPAMVGKDGGPPRLSVTVQTQRGNQVTSGVVVDPREYVAPFVDALVRYRQGEIADELADEGDVVVEKAELGIPARVGEPAHDAATQQTVVLIAQAADDPEDESLVNRIAYFRGNQMVIREQKMGAVPFGARSFHAIVLAGDAAGDDVVAHHAERFLRAAEPPSHDNWVPTPELTTQYARGARQRILEYPAAVTKAIRRRISVPTQHSSDGPDALKELLRLTVPSGDSVKRPRIKQIEGKPDDQGAWHVEVIVGLPPRKKRWNFEPVLKFGTDSGAAIAVEWSSLDAVSNCKIVGDTRVDAAGGAGTVAFRGISDPDSHPVRASRAAVFVDFRGIRSDGGAA